MEESFVSADASDKALLGVVFLNVARTYIPNTKVECHYTLPPNISWSASDWIGIFKVDATSVKDYTTFVWSSTHDGSGEGNSLHCSVQFQAYYLPKAGEQQYQFRYVDCHGIVCGQSTPFTFGDLRPLDDLVTLEDDEASTDMLLVVPKATVLQHQLEESQQERNSLMRSKLQLEEEVGSLKAKVEQLEEELKTSKEDYAKLMKKYQDLSESEAAVTEERDALGRQQVDHVARILELEEGIQFVSEKVLGKEEELERMGVLIKTLQTEKEILNKRLQHEAGEKQQYQTALRTAELGRSEQDLELQALKSHLEEKEAKTLQLHAEVGQLQQKLVLSQQKKLQVDSLCEQLRSTHDLLSANQQKVVLLGEELATASSIRDRTIADLHKSRLEAAETHTKLADMTLKWNEGRGQWWKERADLALSLEAEKEKVARLNIELLKLEKSIQDEKSQKHTLRAEQSRERDTNLVQLSEGKRELKELRSALKVMQMEKEQLREEKRELLEYVRKLEERLEKVADVKWSEVAATEEEEMASTEMTLSLTESPLPDSEDESPEDMRGHTKLSPYSLCDNRSPTKKLSSSREPVQEVVISQPAPISSQKKQVPDDSSSDSEAEDEQAAMMSPARSRGEESSLLLPRLGSAFQDMARGSSSGQTWQRIMAASDSVPVARLSSSTRRECPVCKERLSSDCSLAAFQEHVDSHFFYSAHDPFTFE
ncbi:calcium-binding and coiled-coil domain-containing protein 1 isoform X1 [Pleurodeles waltl]|uniref:calcium-binding and coiled-coil domain-containing protein 1 isoform X1 n=1 Tax=Pleurodeles waltl TaxID=8319 RepID=UPI00370957A5